MRETPDFSQFTVMVIGDIMADYYLFGEVNRISPEAPVPVVEVERKEMRAGGAANVALNLRYLGATPLLLSVAGTDETATAMFDLLERKGISTKHILQNKHRITTLKTRVFDDDKQVVRFDEEDPADLDKKLEEHFIQEMVKILASRKVDMILLQDYNKGVLTRKVIKSVLLHATKYRIPVAVDPKEKNFMEYQNVDLFKPNLREFSEAIGYRINPKSLEGLVKGAEELKLKNRFKNLMVTLSAHGIFCYTLDGEAFIVPARPIKAADVSGAGDTVFAVASLCMMQGFPVRKAAQLANKAAAAVCKKVGVTPVLLKDLK